MYADRPAAFAAGPFLPLPDQKRFHAQGTDIPQVLHGRLFSQGMILHHFVQKSGLASLSALQPGQGFSLLWAKRQRLQSSPQGAIISAVNIICLSPFCSWFDYFR